MDNGGLVANEEIVAILVNSGAVQENSDGHLGVTGGGIPVVAIGRNVIDIIILYVVEVGGKLRDICIGPSGSYPTHFIVADYFSGCDKAGGGPGGFECRLISIGAGI